MSTSTVDNSKIYSAQLEDTSRPTTCTKNNFQEKTVKIMSKYESELLDMLFQMPLKTIRELSSKIALKKAYRPNAQLSHILICQQL